MSTFLQDVAYKRPGTNYYVTPTSEKFSQHRWGVSGVFENKTPDKPKELNEVLNPNHPKVSGVFESQNIENPFMKQEAEYMNDNLKAGIIEVIHIIWTRRYIIITLFHLFMIRNVNEQLPVIWINLRILRKLLLEMTHISKTI